MNTICETTDLLVFSHLRWDFVFQRPQHLLSRHAKHRRVFYVEEPVFGMTELPRLHLRETSENVTVIVPYLPSGIAPENFEVAMTDLVDELVFEEEINEYTAWYYTPMALAFTRHLKPRATIFDCMDELSLFKGAPQTLVDLERELLARADLVTTGGQSLFEAKKHTHHNIHPLPSSIDIEHFARARRRLPTPAAQGHIPHPQIGFYGVIDERFDHELLLGIADLRPEYQFVIIGPVVKIDPAGLPTRPNIHYLGKKEYQELPLYVSSWDCAMMPFERNEATRYISPTKTPEYLAAGRPVVSTSIRDVVYPYLEKGLVHIADTPRAFVDAIDRAMAERHSPDWIDRVDHFLRDTSWDMTFHKMATLELQVTRPKEQRRASALGPMTLSAGGQI